MKTLILAAAGLLVAASPALAEGHGHGGGHGGGNHGGGGWHGGGGGRPQAAFGGGQVRAAQGARDYGRPQLQNGYVPRGSWTGRALPVPQQGSPVAQADRRPWQGQARYGYQTPNGRSDWGYRGRPNVVVNNNYRTTYNWNRNWRDDRRYDWRSYRQYNTYIYRQPVYYNPYGWGYQRFSIGINIGPAFYSDRYWINDPWAYRLPSAYDGYRWIRYYDDALLIDLRTGRVVDTIYDFFY